MKTSYSLFEKIELSSQNLFAQGNARECYFHPQDQNLCIKIPKSIRSTRGIKKETRYMKYLKKRDMPFDMIAKYHRPIWTNFGQGEVYELVRDIDGNVSKSIRHYLHLNDLFYNELIAYQLEKLRTYLKTNKIIFTDLNPTNILLQKLFWNDKIESYRLVIIDGIGHNNDFPFFEYFRPLAIYKTAKKWEKYRKKWIIEFPYLEGKINSFLYESPKNS